MIHTTTFKDIDGKLLTLSQTRRPYGRLLAAHCNAAFNHAQENMKIFGLFTSDLSNHHRYIEELINNSFNEDIDTNAKVLKWLIESTNCSTTATQSASDYQVFFNYTL